MRARARLGSCQLNPSIITCAHQNPFGVMDEWNVVSRKRGAGRRLAAPYLNSASAHHPRVVVAPTAAGNAVFDDLGIVDNDEELDKLLGRVKRAFVKVERSSFYEKFMRQMDELQVMETLARAGDAVSASPEADHVLVRDGSSVLEVQGAGGGTGEDRSKEVDGEKCSSGELTEKKKEEGMMKAGNDNVSVEMILYGVGSIYTAEIARCQLALALLIKQKFSSIGRLLVYDPIMTSLECRVMRSLGCVPLETNDCGRRPISGPTLFYMPHNEVELYDSVVLTSLDPFKLNQVVIIGNSFRTYSERWTTYPLPDGDIPSYLLTVQEFVEEIPVADDFYPSAFNDTSWHLFFNLEARQADPSQTTGTFPFPPFLSEPPPSPVIKGARHTLIQAFSCQLYPESSVT